MKTIEELVQQAYENAMNQALRPQDKNHVVSVVREGFALRDAEAVPVYAFRRKGLTNFCTCTQERYAELSEKPLFEVVKFYTHSPGLAAEVEQLRADLEIERMRLAACGVAALGYFKECEAEYKSASLDDTLRLYAKNEELRAELAALKQGAQEPFEIDWPEYHEEAMGCGLEDRNITDRYEAMRHGWDCAIEHVASRLPETLYTNPATDYKPIAEKLLVALESSSITLAIYGDLSNHSQNHEAIDLAKSVGLKGD